MKPVAVLGKRASVDFDFSSTREHLVVRGRIPNWVFAWREALCPAR
jgi:hypothetical protein